MRNLIYLVLALIILIILLGVANSKAHFLPLELGDIGKGSIPLNLSPQRPTGQPGTNPTEAPAQGNPPPGSQTSPGSQGL